MAHVWTALPTALPARRQPTVRRVLLACSSPRAPVVSYLCVESEFNYKPALTADMHLKVCMGEHMRAICVVPTSAAHGCMLCL